MCVCGVHSCVLKIINLCVHMGSLEEDIVCPVISPLCLSLLKWGLSLDLKVGWLVESPVILLSFPPGAPMLHDHTLLHM